jgi:L-arabinose isomerase
MREVAVTEGNKVAAQIKFGYSVNGYGMGDLINNIKATKNVRINQLVEEYETLYDLSDQLQANGSKRMNLIESAKIELGLRSFLKEGGFTAFTDTFENLHGLSQVPGIAIQRLMSDGYGFGAEGDWKTAALVRAMKVMSDGMDGGNSFMEDYTYHFQSNGSQVLGAHMLEVCPTITHEKPRCEVHPLSIGGKEDPVRLVFNGTQGRGLNASMIDLGDRFRLIVNTIEAVNPKKLPKLPVARVLWHPQPNLKLAAEAWILAGGAHHICYSQSVTPNHLRDFAEMLDIEYILIDSDSKIEDIKNELKWNSVYYANRN